jgi:hypothetical protein
MNEFKKRKKRTVISFPEIKSDDGSEGLHYSRPARKSIDGCNGYLYVHVWRTGYQQLIFDSHDHAKSWLNKHVELINCERVA